MLLNSREATSFDASDSGSAHFFVLRGRLEILRLRTVLENLSALSGQVGAMDYLEYFLTSKENLKKIPYIVLVALRSDVDVLQLRAEDIRGAVLVYEYKVFGLRSTLFTTADFNGNRAVIAPPALRRQISAAVCRYLMQRGAQVVLLSLDSGSTESCETCFEKAMAGEKKRWWTTQTREVGATIVLHKMLDATLAEMGKNTRRNLKRYRRKAEAELAYSFESDANSMLTMVQLTELNQASTHPVSQSVLKRRCETLKASGFFCVGLRQSDGQWMSLVGGRRNHNVTEIDWQMNRQEFARYSIGTVIRSYLIEYEIALGTGKLLFEGGTPHTMRHSFQPEEAMDIVVMNRSLFVFLLRRYAKWPHLKKNFLLQTLVNPAVKWQLR
jgi:Acetyltransferase (GNAT) domain